jgi:hypothetical protein
MKVLAIRLSTQLVLFFLLSLPTLACAPAPTCWMQSGRDYLKLVCINSARYPDMLKPIPDLGRCPT